VPLFEYECLDCRARFEKLVLNRETEVVCGSCGSKKVSQLLSVFAVGGSPQSPAPEPGPCDRCGAAQRGLCGMN